MRITPEEFKEMLARTERVRGVAARSPADSELLRQAAVATDHLTSDPNWNVFLQRVQALITQETATLESLPAQLTNPNLPIEGVQGIRVQMVAAKAKVDAWTRVLELPNEILAAAQKPKTAA